MTEFVGAFDVENQDLIALFMDLHTNSNFRKVLTVLSKDAFTNLAMEMSASEGELMDPEFFDSVDSALVYIRKSLLK